MPSLPPNEPAPVNSERGSQLVLRAPDALRLPPESRIVSPEERFPFWKQSDWERLWLAAYRFPWRSLVLVPAGDMPPGFTPEIAAALVYTGSLHLGEPVRLANATQVPLGELKQFVNEMEALADAGARVIVAVGPLRASPTATAICRAADQALLCVPLEVASMADAKRTVADVGAQRFLGSAVFRM